MPEDTPIVLNPIPFLREYVGFVEKKYGKTAFMFAPSWDTPGTAEFLSAEIRNVGDEMRLAPPPGLRSTSHCLRRGMLSEFVLHSPPGTL